MGTKEDVFLGSGASPVLEDSQIHRAAIIGSWSGGGRGSVGLCPPRQGGTPAPFTTSPQPWTHVARGRSRLLSPSVQAGPPTGLHAKEFSRVWPVYHRNRKDNFDWYMENSFTI